jgi:hypothetical protein
MQLSKAYPLSTYTVLSVLIARTHPSDEVGQAKAKAATMKSYTELMQAIKPFHDIACKFN